jgi:hypothetical protein
MVDKTAQSRPGQANLSTGSSRRHYHCCCYRCCCYRCCLLLSPLPPLLLLLLLLQDWKLEKQQLKHRQCRDLEWEQLRGECKCK